MAHIIRAESQEMEPVTPANGTNFSGEEINKIVGGYFERVSLGDKHEMWLNEDGKSMGLPINVGATGLFLMAHTFSSDVIVGDVLICAPGEVR